jgi:hypothetical protein
MRQKEGAYEFGLQDDTGALQGAANGAPGKGGCWRWFGTVRVPLHECEDPVARLPNQFYF